MSETLAQEATETRIKRLRMRSWRRGIKEMDLILGPFADQELTKLSSQDLELYERLLDQNDQDLLAWSTGAAEVPDWLEPLLTRIVSRARTRMQAG